MLQLAAGDIKRDMWPGTLRLIVKPFGEKGACVRIKVCPLAIRIVAWRCGASLTFGLLELEPLS